MVLGPAPVLKRWPSGQGGLLLWGQDLGEVGEDQQSQMCRWPEVLLLVGQCSEEPVVTLQAKKTRTALICTWMCVQIVQRQLYSALLHSKLYRGSENNSNLQQLCFDLPKTRHAQATHLRLYDDAPVRWRQLRGLLSWLSRTWVRWWRSRTTSPARADEILKSSTLDELHGFRSDKA